MILYIIVLLLVLYLLTCNQIIIKENIEAFKNMILDSGKIYVINLEKRKDRKKHFEDIYDKLKINKLLDKPIYYKAVDGYNTNIPTWWYKESPYTICTVYKLYTIYIVYSACIVYTIYKYPQSAYSTYIQYI